MSNERENERNNNRNCEMKGELNNDMNRKEETDMNCEAKKNRLKKRITNVTFDAVLLLVFGKVLVETNGFGGVIPELPCQNLQEFALGITLAMLVLNVLYLSGVMDKIRQWKFRIIKK